MAYITLQHLRKAVESLLIKIGNRFDFLNDKVDDLTDSLEVVAFSGDYNDLDNTPTIPTIPTHLSSFINDVGYLTTANNQFYAKYNFPVTIVFCDSTSNVLNIQKYQHDTSGSDIFRTLILVIRSQDGNDSTTSYINLNSRFRQIRYSNGLRTVTSTINNEIVYDKDGVQQTNNFLYPDKLYYLKVEYLNNGTTSVDLTFYEIPLIDDNLSDYMKKGIDYVTAGKNSSTTLGNNATAEGYNTTSSGNNAHAEGANTIASGSAAHSEGGFTNSLGNTTHSEGYRTLALANYSHAEGNGTFANGNSSHAEGNGTGTALNLYVSDSTRTNFTSSAIEPIIPYGVNATDCYIQFGSNAPVQIESWVLKVNNSIGSIKTVAPISSASLSAGTSIATFLFIPSTKHSYAHAEGASTIANDTAQHVGGKYNLLATGAEVIGGGTANNDRKNIRTLDWSGNETLAGKLTLGADPTAAMDATTKQYVDTSISNIGTPTASSIGAIPIHSGNSYVYHATAGSTQGAAAYINSNSISFAGVSGTSYPYVGLSRNSSSGLRLFNSASTTVTLTNVATPTNDTDAANKKYVDDALISMGVVLDFQGTKTTVSELPSTGQQIGNVWIVTADNSEYVWTGEAWEKFGPTIDLSGYLTTESDPVFAASAAYGITSQDISNWNVKADTDEKVKITDLNNTNSFKPFLFANSETASTRTESIYASTSIIYNAYGPEMWIKNPNGNNYLNLRPTSIGFYESVSLSGRLMKSSLTASRTWTLPDKTGTIALTSDIPTVPTNISAFTNDAGYLTSYTETDPTVPNWAKQSTKPSYTASEVGAIADTAPAASITSTDITNWNSKADSSSLSGYVAKTGDTMSGDLEISTGALRIVNSNSTSAGHQTGLEFKWDDSAFLRIRPTGYSSSYGITLSAQTNSGGSTGMKLEGIETPTTDKGAANKKYVDDAISGITYPVTSVNTKTGTVTLTASDVGAIADTAPAAGITSTDISNWDAKISDDKTWNGVSLNSGRTDTTADLWIPAKSNSNLEGQAYWVKTTQELPTSSSIEFVQIPRYKQINNNWYLQSTTPTANDNSTKVATTAFVTTAISGITHPVTSVNEQTGNVLIDKIKTSAAADNTTYNLMGTASTNVNTQVVDVYNPTLLTFSKYDNNFARLTVGSTSTPGQIRLYSSTSSATGYIDLKSGSTSTNTRTITFPDATGTVALTSDIPNVSSWALAANKPSYTFSELTTTPTTLGGYGITDAYTKTEVDGLVSGVLHYKGTKATVSALPSSGNTTGDVWHITADGSEYAWDGSDWQELGTATDLSGYVPTSRTVNGKALSADITLSASDVSALPSNTAYVSTFNGQSGAITYTAPVTSVNGQTGAVTLTIPSAITNNYSNDNDGDILINGTSNHTTNSTLTSTKTSGALTFSTTNGLQIGKAHSEEGSKGSINLSNSASSNQNYTTITPSATAAVTVTLPNATGTLALTSDIPSVPSWALESTKPTYTASEVGALASTVDVTKWNGVTLVKSEFTATNNNFLIPYLTGTTSTEAYLMYASYTPTANAIARYNSSRYLVSTTPTASDNSTKVATTAFVKTAIGALTIPTRYDSSTNTTGYLTMADLPIYDGTVI